MEFLEIKKALTKWEKDDRSVAVKIAVASAVMDNIHTNDDREFDYACNVIMKYWLERGMEADLDLFCYWLQRLVDDGAYDSVTWRGCLDDAYDNALGGF